MSLSKNLTHVMAIMVAGMIGFQSLAIGQTSTPPAPRQTDAKKPVDVDLIEEGREFVQGMAAISKRRGLSLNEAKEMMLKVQKSQLSKTVATAAGADSEALDEAISKKVKQLTQLHGMMMTSKTALDVLIRNPIKDPVIRGLYTLVLASNQVSQLMALNDAQGKQIFFKNDSRKREILRAWVMAIPLVGAALIRWYDPTATINIEKIHDEMQVELGKLSEQESSPDFKKEIVNILDITKKQLEEANKQATFFKDAIKGVTENTQGNFIFSDTNINFANLVAFGSLIYAIMETLGGRWAQMAQHGKDAAVMLSEQYKAINGAIKKAKASSQMMAARGRQFAGATADFGKQIAGHRYSATGGTAVGNITDIIGNVVAGTNSDAVNTARIVAVDYLKVIAEIETTISNLRGIK